MTERDTRRDRILDQLRGAEGRALSIRELMQRARLHPGERTEVKRVLRDLAREGLLARDGKRWSMPSATPKRDAPAEVPVRSGPVSDGPRRPRLETRERPGRNPQVVGTLTRHRDGYGFVARLDRGGDDVFLPPDEAGKAVSGDLVRVEIVPGLRGRSAGRLVEVVERRRRLVLGTYHARAKSSFVLPADPELDGPIPVHETRLAKDGEVVKVALEPGTPLRGEVVERVGEPGTPRVEVLRVAYAKGFADLFPEDVRAEAERVPDHVLEAEKRAGRRDLTDLPLVTIDGEDARDFDDAVYVERRGGRGKAKGYRLVVAIADVSHYVRAGSALDAEALRRGTSVYFPMQVLPMLPERLSNGICSLNPDVERLCMVADLSLDARGHVVGAELYDAVMRSAARCTYTEVARVLDGEKLPHRERFRAQFGLMAELQEKLTAMRRARGAIDFDLPESKIVLDAEGKVETIERRPRNRAHRIVEEFMLAANEAVARHFATSELPTVYRVHGLPDEDKVDAFRELAAAHGFDVPQGPLGPKQLNALLERFRGHAQERALNQLLLRAMMQAVYAAENIGHYGLAAEHYLHFTSPIRRYPDLIVHRLLRETFQHGGELRGKLPARDLEEIAALASERERAAMQAEREIAAYYAALFLSEHVGERFQGVVASVVEFGLFVELQPWFVEGLVKVTDLGAGFGFDPRLHALVEPRSGRAFRVGDEVEVEVVAASPLRRQVDLALVEAGEAVRAPRPRSRDGEEQEARFDPRRSIARARARLRAEEPARGGGHRPAKQQDRPAKQDRPGKQEKGGKRGKPAGGKQAGRRGEKRRKR